MTTNDSLWACPKCGKKFVMPNMWHSCVKRSVNDFFADKTVYVRRLFDYYLDFVEHTVGPVIVNVDKTRISFQNRARFTTIAGVRKTQLVISLWMKRKFENPRFTRSEFIPPSNWVYQFHLKESTDLDEEVAEWLKEAWSVGNGEFTPRE